MGQIGNVFNDYAGNRDKPEPSKQDSVRPRN